LFFLTTNAKLRTTNFYFSLFSSETVSFFLRLARLRLIAAFPPLDFIFLRNPYLLLLFLRDG